MGKLRLRTLILSAFFIVLISQFTLATYSWNEYGNDFTPLQQAQYGTNAGNFPTNVYAVTTAQGIGDETNSQPLIFNFNSSLLQGELQQYIIFQQDSLLQIYNKNLILVQEINTPSPSSYQIGLTGSTKSDIAGIYNTSDTNYQYNVYHFNAGTSAFSLSFQENFSVTAGTIASGMRCNSVNCFFLLSKSGTNATFYKINSTTNSNAMIMGANSTYTEPVGFLDINGDGTNEYWTHSNNDLIIFQADGTIIKQIFPTQVFLDAKIYQSDASSLWKIAVLTDTGGGSLKVVGYRLDGSNYYTSPTLLPMANFLTYSVGSLAIADYDGDGYSDVYYNYGFYRSGTGNSQETFGIVKGNSGSSLFNYTIASTSSVLLTEGRLTIADMNGDGKADFITKVTGTTYPTMFKVISSLNNTAPLYNSSVASGSSCVPADVDFNGKLDIICSGASRTTIFYSNYTNQAPTITTITYSPSTSIAVGNSVTAIITANDVEGDGILYSHSCFIGDTFSTPNSNPAQICTYASIGIYNMTIGVTDGYHIPQANTFTQEISVTLSGTICGNAICESGETSVNCPVDCPASQGQNTTQVTGGIQIPTKIVDVNNVESGLLPTIYYGILGFLSGMLYPFMIVVFVIFLAMILFTIGIIIANLIKKIGDKN